MSTNKKKIFYGNLLVRTNCHIKSTNPLNGKYKIVKGLVFSSHGIEVEPYNKRIIRTIMKMLKSKNKENFKIIGIISIDKNLGKAFE